MTGITKLKNAQEERRARTAVHDGNDYYGENDDDIRFALGLDVEVAEAEARPREELLRLSAC